MRYVKETAGAPLGAILCVCACLVGCERKDTAPSTPPPEPAAKPAVTSTVSRAGVRSTAASIEERAHDEAYQKRLKDFGDDMKGIMQRRAKIEARMATLRERAKRAIPSDATDAQVEAELEGHPKRYPAWRELVAARESLVVEEERLKAAAQATVARRIFRKESDGRAKDAVSEAK